MITYIEPTDPVIKEIACDLYYKRSTHDIILGEFRRLKHTEIELMLKEIDKTQFKNDDDAILEIQKRLKIIFENTGIPLHPVDEDNVELQLQKIKKELQKIKKELQEVKQELQEIKKNIILNPIT
jgi:hypothetical protein